MNDSYQIPMHIQSDEKGFYDRECPNEGCLYTFKVDLHDWEEKIAGGDMHCPRCGLTAFHDQWFTQGQIKALNENISSFALGLVHDELKAVFKETERETRRNKFVRITYQPGRRPQYANLPITQSEEWATEITCNKCGMRFSVLGNAYFCPCCGRDLTTNAIMDSLNSYRRRIEGLGKLHHLYEESYSVEEAERQVNLLREDTMGALVGTFESFAKNLYVELGGALPRGNVFQRVADGSELFEQLVGKAYRDFIGADGVKDMTVLVNQRHLLTHGNGIVDEKYIRNTGDNSYELGQRIIVRDKDLLRLLDIIERIVNGLLATQFQAT